MFKKNFFPFFLLLLILPFTAAAPQVLSNFNEDADILASVSYLNFNNGQTGNGTNQARVKIQTSGNTVDNSFNWSSGTYPSLVQNSFSIVYDGSTVTTITRGNTKVDASGNLGDLNYIQFYVKTNQTNTKVKIENLVVNGTNMGSFEADGNTSNQDPKFRIEDLNLTSSFTISGSLSLSGAQANNSSAGIDIGYLAPVSQDETGPVVEASVDSSLSYLGDAVVLNASAADAESNISTIEYSFDQSNWTQFTGTFDSPNESVTASLTGLSCAGYTVYVRAFDIHNNVSSTISVTFDIYKNGSLSGTVRVGSSGVGGVLVKLLQLDGSVYTDVTTAFSSSTSDPGTYKFDNLTPDDYKVLIVLPLGFSGTSESLVTVPFCENDMTADFSMTANAIINSARGKGYWKHQFDTHLKNKPGFQETAVQLNAYINGIVSNYVPHYELTEVFNSNETSFTYWSGVLSYGGNDMRKKAQAHFAALLFNYAALKISQLEIVTADGNDVSDVITESSEILSNSAATFAQLTKVKDICEMVSTQVTIPAGLVPDHNKLYKTGKNTIPAEFSLSNNYPNPFNPSTQISFSLPEAGYVTLKVYDVIGNEVAALVNSPREAGIHNVTFDASGLPSGVYLYKITAGNFSSTKKMILMK